MKTSEIIKYAIVVLFAALVTWAVMKDTEKHDACVAKGGEMVKTGKYGSTCIKKDAIIKGP